MEVGWGRPEAAKLLIDSRELLWFIADLSEPLPPSGAIRHDFDWQSTRETRAVDSPGARGSGSQLNRLSRASPPPLLAFLSMANLRVIKDSSARRRRRTNEARDFPLLTRRDN